MITVRFMSDDHPCQIKIDSASLKDATVGGIAKLFGFDVTFAFSSNESGTGTFIGTLVDAQYQPEDDSIVAFSVNPPPSVELPRL